MPAERASVAPRPEHGRMTVDVGDADHQIRALYQCTKRVRASACHVATMKLEGMPFARGGCRVALLSPLYTTNDSDVHADLAFSWQVEAGPAANQAALRARCCVLDRR